MIKLVASLFIFLFLGSLFANTPSLITLYGIEKGSSVRASNKPGRSYQLQVGAFHDQFNANQCKNRLQKKTNTPIKIHSPKKGLYFVLVGPFKNTRELKQVSNQLLSNKTISQPKLAHLPKKKPIQVSRLHKNTVKKKQIARGKSIKFKEPVVVHEDSRLQAKQIAQLIEMARTLDSNEEKERQAIENIVNELKQESLTNEVRLKTTNDPEEIATLKNRQVEITQELESFVTLVMKRISRKDNVLA